MYKCTIQNFTMELYSLQDGLIDTGSNSNVVVEFYENHIHVRFAMKILQRFMGMAL